MATLENTMEVPQKLKLKLSYDPAIHSETLRRKNYNSKDTYGLCSQQPVYQKSKAGNKLNVHPTDEWMRKCGMYTTENTAQPSERMQDATAATRMDPAIITPTSSEKEKHMLSHICKSKT